MEVLKLDIVGTFSYKPDIEIVSYNNESYTKECVICKRSLFEPSYDTICDNTNIMNDIEVVIGKCGHMFHGDCLGKWLKTCDTCPIDKVKWCLHRVADTTTKLVVCESKSNKSEKFTESISRNKFNKSNTQKHQGDTNDKNNDYENKYTNYKNKYVEQKNPKNT